MAPLAALAIQAAPAALGFITNLFGKKRRKEQEDKSIQGMSELTNILRGNLDQDYFDSTEAMGTMREIDENFSNNMDEIDAIANMSGMTDEARIALMGKNMNAKQKAYAGLSRNSDLWRQRALQNYQGALGQLFSAGMQNRQLQNDSLNNIVGGFQSAIDGATNVGAFDFLLGKKPNSSKISVNGRAGAQGIIPKPKFQNTLKF